MDDRTTMTDDGERTEAWGVRFRREREGEGHEAILEMTGRTASLGVGLTQPAGIPSPRIRAACLLWNHSLAHAIYR